MLFSGSTESGNAHVADVLNALRLPLVVFAFQEEKASPWSKDDIQCHHLVNSLCCMFALC